MNSLWDIRIFLGLAPKESPCIMCPKGVMNLGKNKVLCDVLASQLLNSSKLLNDRSAFILCFGNERT
jgi:hypothetical protein